MQPQLTPKNTAINQWHSNTTQRSKIVIDNDLRMIDGHCNYHFYIQNHLRQGGCEHMIALRIKLLI